MSRSVCSHLLPTFTPSCVSYWSYLVLVGLPSTNHGPLNRHRSYLVSSSDECWYVRESGVRYYPYRDHELSLSSRFTPLVACLEWETSEVVLPSTLYLMLLITCLNDPKNRDKVTESRTKVIYAHLRSYDYRNNRGKSIRVLNPTQTLEGLKTNNLNGGPPPPSTLTTSTYLITTWIVCVSCLRNLLSDSLILGSINQRPSTLPVDTHLSPVTP